MVGALQVSVPERWRMSINLAAQATALVVAVVGEGAAIPVAVFVFGATSGAMTLERATITARWFGTQDFGLASGTIASVGLIGRAAGPFAVELAHAQMSYGAVLVGVAAVLMLAGVVFASAEHARRGNAVPRGILYSEHPTPNTFTPNP
jgi:hypothetical protein